MLSVENANAIRWPALLWSVPSLDQSRWLECRTSRAVSWLIRLFWTGLFSSLAVNNYRGCGWYGRDFDCIQYGQSYDCIQHDWDYSGKQHGWNGLK